MNHFHSLFACLQYSHTNAIKKTFDKHLGGSFKYKASALEEKKVFASLPPFRRSSDHTLMLQQTTLKVGQQEEVNLALVLLTSGAEARSGHEGFLGQGQDLQASTVVVKLAIL